MGHQAFLPTDAGVEEQHILEDIGIHKAISLVHLGSRVKPLSDDHNHAPVLSGRSCGVLVCPFCTIYKLGSTLGIENF